MVQNQSSTTPYESANHGYYIQHIYRILFQDHFHKPQQPRGIPCTAETTSDDRSEASAPTYIQGRNYCCVSVSSNPEGRRSQEHHG